MSRITQIYKLMFDETEDSIEYIIWPGLQVI